MEFFMKLEDLALSPAESVSFIRDLLGGIYGDDGAISGE
jgi:hypothetical protein